jgi:hypothetical protein
MRWLRPAHHFLFRLGLIAIALLLARDVWIAFDFEDGAAPEIARVYRDGKDQVLNGLEQPKRRFLAAVETDIHRLNPFRPSFDQAITSLSDGPPVPPALPEPESPQKTVKRRPASRAPAPPLLPYITIGSTKGEVIDLLGAPTSDSGDKLTYGQSVLYLKDDSVAGWRINTDASPLRVKMWPESAVDTSLERFGVGASKDVVLFIQGTPTAFSKDEFEYGRSAVFFRENRVVSWKNDPTSVPLRVVNR